MQVKLLRFLQEREISRVGGNETISVDVRIIAATNANLEELVARGVFRTDLYYRLHVLPVRVPPLRERREDIPLLVDHFIQKYSKQTLRREALLQPYEMKVLQEYDWPGNVRELENIIERAMVMGTQVEKILRGIAELRRQKSRAESALAPNVIELRPAGRGEAPRPPGEDQSQHAFYTPATLEDLERRHIVETLKYTGGNRGEAARILGINPATLWRKMKSYQIADPKAEESS
ncbi:sigma-54-dependent Fis family transcriptional regulator [Candidatus Sumerlaeota bacterium]|nr:sigma-54-dependent Fis family transcriptional regulator [Candidatus Sumerlaeota bacterium]